jgi:hypothetical protein
MFKEELSSRSFTDHSSIRVLMFVISLLFFEISIGKNDSPPGGVDFGFPVGNFFLIPYP